MLCIVDEASLGTALIVGCMSAKQDAMWITFIWKGLAVCGVNVCYENRQP